MNKITPKIKSYSFAIFILFFLINFIIGVSAHVNDLNTILTVRTDSLGYYQYLPGLFVDHTFTPSYYTAPLPNGNNLSIFSFGVALLQLPFFILGHIFALLSGYQADGFSSPYAVAIIASSSFYVSLGFSLISRYLQKITQSIIITVTTIVIIYFGTNLMYYSSFEFGMSHVYNFFIFSVVLFAYHFIQSKNFNLYLIIISICIGLTLTIKPYNIFGFIFIFPFSKTEFRSLFLGIKQHLLFVFLGMLTIFLFILAQSLYWFDLSGSLFLFSYGQIGEGFNWTQPELFNILFSVQNGWFVYSPLVLLGIIGLFFYFKINRSETIKISILLLLAYYTFASWWAWWFGGAYGHRAFVEYYSFLMIPMSYLLLKISQKEKALKIALALVIVILIYSNYKLTWIYQSPWDGPDWGWDDLYGKYRQVF